MLASPHADLQCQVAAGTAAIRLEIELRSPAAAGGTDRDIRAAGLQAVLVAFDIESLTGAPACGNQSVAATEDASGLLRGRKLADLLADLRERSGATFPDDFEARLRAAEQISFEAQLKPVRGVREVLGQIGWARCVASSAPSSILRALTHEASSIAWRS